VEALEDSELLIDEDTPVDEAVSPEDELETEVKVVEADVGKADVVEAMETAG